MLARVIVNLVNGSEYSFTALSGENLTSVEHLQEFGFASEKPDGEDANGIALFYGGDRGNSSLLVLEVPKFKPDLSAGESALFNAFSALIKLTAIGNIELTGTTIELNGSSNAGLIKIDALTTAINTLVAVYNSHTHTAHNTATLMLQTPLVKTAYENTKVVH